ncbi:unnamed protein product [Acanthoscelides obtectus]|uniref:Uncharacterized protein n=1 Tax=Acanthoscelides obtectus TaxID=200917 RepID=A0A9P0KG99_ACAOB|nr:unnamed protein product [Acanthoscelides obtectus]CAK1672694.1 hypothetical protein AOBTE_LOCUS29048 [Acanthoscelides obtectus]
MNDKAFSPVPTKASLKKKSVEVEVTSFISYKSKKQKSTDDVLESTKNENKDKNDQVYSIKRLKQEIKSFTLKNAENQREAKMQLAIKLGAKPLKKKYTNYKTLLQEKQKEKAREKKEAAFQQLGKNSHGRCNAKGKSYDRKRKKEKEGILGIYGKVKKVNN